MNSITALPGISNRPGSIITLNGSGFGCQGELVFLYSNAIANDGKVGAVEYDHQVIYVDEFISRSDTQLRFRMPELDSDHSVARHVAKVYYQRGAQQSNRLVLNQYIRDIAVTAANPLAGATENLPQYGPDAGSEDVGEEELRYNGNNYLGDTSAFHGGRQ